jgi:hypothetical protein
MMAFKKNPRCPSSEELLSFEKSELTGKKLEKVEKHLAGCEFCAAEIALYRRFPQAESENFPTEMPAPLYELAKAILSDKKEGFRLLDKMLSEKETLRLKQA